MSTVQFYISRAVADALPIERIAPGARAFGIAGVQLEYSTVSAGPSRMRITCSVDVAYYLVEQLRNLAGNGGSRGDERLMVSCAEAVKAALDGIDAAVRRPLSHGFATGMD
jgi:hypothetical protein